MKSTDSREQNLVISPPDDANNHYRARSGRSGRSSSHLKTRAQNGNAKHSRSRSHQSMHSENSNSGGTRNSMGHRSQGHRSNRRNHELNPKQLISSSSPSLQNQKPVIITENNQLNHPGPEFIIQDLTTPIYNDETPASMQELIPPIEKIDNLNALDCRESELSSSDLESIAIIYDKIRQVHKHSCYE